MDRWSFDTHHGLYALTVVAAAGSTPILAPPASVISVATTRVASQPPLGGTVTPFVSGSVWVEATTSSTTEGSGIPGVFTIYASSAPSASLMVNFSMGGTAGTGSGDVDYTLPGTVATIPAGQTSVTVNVTAGDDNSTNETAASETAIMTLTSTGSEGGDNFSVGSPSSATVTINDNDIGGGGGSGSTVTVAAAPGSTSEAPGSKPGDFVFTANPAPTSNLTVTFSAGGTAPLGTDALLSGASQAGSNFTVTIPAGQASANVYVQAVEPGDDNGTQPPYETVTANIQPETGYTVGGAGNATVTIAELLNPEVDCTCSYPKTGSTASNATPPTNLLASTSKSDGGDAADYSSSIAPIRYGLGSIADDTVALFQSNGFGESYGPSLGFASNSDYAIGQWSGTGMVDSATPIIQQTANGGIAVVITASGALYFNYANGSYVSAFFNQETLAPDGSSGDFVVTDTSGDQVRFYGFETTIPQDQRGSFKSFTDPNGNVIAVTSHDAAGQITEVQRSYSSNGQSTVESFLYTYLATGVNAGLIGNVTWRKETNNGPWTTIRQAVYSYYDGTQAEGNAGDLQTIQVEDANANVLDTYYYRYYTGGEADGYQDGLEYYFSPESYARLAAAVGNPLTATDAQVAPYADNYYQYDSQQRVTEEIAQGQGAASGLGTFMYSYTTSTNSPGANSWSVKTVETLPDGNRNIVYTNYAGEAMMIVNQDVSDPVNPGLQGKQWITLYVYDSEGRLIETAQPSAVTSYNDSYADLMNFVSGKSSYISNSTGLIDLYDYGTSTTATSSTPGDVLGYNKDDKIQEGQDGSPILLDSEQYISHTFNGVILYVQATSTVYRITDGSGAETTSYSYTWYANSNLMQSMASSAPVISSAQNGPGAADVTTSVYDTYGQLIWTKDADGFINYYTYDTVTGAIITDIQDVNTADSSEFSNLPAGWATPSGGGLNLITTYQVDALGRTTEMTDPNGNLTYYVYDDVDHEVREYDGWNSSTDTTIGPTIVTREDYAGSYFETLTMSATPHVTNGAPDGTETIGNIQTLSRQYTDTAGRVIEQDDYFYLGGMTYSTAKSIGTYGVNYYSTFYGFDASGNAQRVLDSNGTVTDTLYDGLDRPTAVYVGTDDSTTNGGPWSPANASSSSNMVLVTLDQYDGNQVGDGNLTQETQFVDSNPGDARVTVNVYDWRDRLVATKSGVQTTTSTVPTISDAGFEQPALSSGTYQGNPAATSWIFLGSAGISSNGSAFTSGNPNAPDGSQVAFIQQTGGFSQQISGWAAGDYQLVFQAAQRQNYQASRQNLEVLVDGVVVATITPASTTYATYRTSPFAVTAGTHTIELLGLDSAGGDNTVFIDSISIVASTLPTLADPGFEAPYLGNTYASPSGTGWTFAGAYAGISGNGSALTSANPNAPEGTQVGFIQNQGSMSQTSTNWTAGTYQIAFLAAQRAAGNTAPESFEVLVDGSIVADVTPSSTSYLSYVTVPFAVSSGSHTIMIEGLYNGSGTATAFIDSIGVNPALGASAQPANPSFEAPSLGNGNYQIDPSGASWTFSSQNAGISANNSSYTSSNPPAPQGSQVAFLENVSSISQTITTWTAGTYEIQFLAAQRGSLNSSVQNLEVLVDNTVVANITPSGSSYSTYISSPFTVTAGSHSITIEGLDSAGGSNTALIDSVAILDAPVATVPVTNAGFETPVVASGTYAVAPSGATWTFSGSYSGISGNNSAFTSANPPAPEGSQVAFLENVSTISQSVSGWFAGTFQISFFAAQRGYDNSSSQSIDVLVDGAVVATIVPSTTTYLYYTTPTFTVTAGAHTIEFEGLNSGNTAFIDGVSIAETSPPNLGDYGFESPVLSSGSYQYNPSGTPWTFSPNVNSTSGSGMSAAGSTFTSGNPAAPEGSQVAFLQGTGQFSQTISWPAGNYQVSFDAAQSAGNGSSSEDFEVLIDGAVVGDFIPSGTGYAVYTTSSFTVAPGNHTITFEGVDSAGSSVSVLIDAVLIAAAAAGGSAIGVNAESPSDHQPITYFTYDNLDETTSISQYDGAGVAPSAVPPNPALLRSYEVMSYDDQGRVYQELVYDINQTTGAVSQYALTTNYYYDHRGDQIAESDPGGLWTKDQYDGAGRLIVESLSDGGSGTTWAEAGSLSGDQVLTQTLYTYDNNGNVILTEEKDRFNTDTSAQTGALGNPTTGPQSRNYYSASYYDAADRLTATVDVGTNGGIAYTRPATPPSSSDTTLVTTYAYNAAGWVHSVTDPRGIVSQTSYDALGRVTQTIDAYNPSINSGNPTTSANQTTNYTYDGMDNVLSVTAVEPSGTPNQTTAYVYGVTTASGSAINSNDLLAKVEYPDPTTGNPSTSASNQESYTYNANGDVLTYKDPNGTVHTYSYDVLGRQTSDAITTLGSGVDGSVLRLTTAYDALGNPVLFTSFNAASGGSIVNQVQDVYNGLDQLIGEYQSVSGAVNVSTTPEVQYVYTEMLGGQNNSRLTQMIYPNGRKIDYVYGVGLDSSISRLTGIVDDATGLAVEDYKYLGLSTIVEWDHPQTNINLSYIQQTGDTKFINSGGDQYVGLDQFGRVIDQNWWNPSSQTSTDRFQYGYDRVGNVLYQNNLVNPSESLLHHANSTTSGDNNSAYDPLGREIAYSRGVLSASGHNGSSLDTVSSPSQTQSWGLDALGNWSSQTSSGVATTRTFNAQNETTSVSGSTAPTYNSNGDTTSDNGDTYVYDAWDRLVAVKSGSTTIASYSYDALGRRITETYGSTTNNLYYSPQWQVIEECQNGTSNTNVTFQYVWGASYIDQMVFRDTYSGGVETQRLYSEFDANYDTTSLVNMSGSVVERYLYDPYGNMTVLTAGWTPVSGNVSQYGWRYQFQGGRLDSATGWYDFRNRDYIPTQGTWAERDPLGFGGGDKNLFRYEGGSPAVGFDPFGLTDGIPIPGGGTIHIDGETMGTRTPHVQYGVAPNQVKIRIPTDMTNVDELATLPNINKSMIKKLLKNPAIRQRLQNQLKNARAKCGLAGIVLTIVLAAPEVANAAEKGGLPGAASAAAKVAVGAAVSTAESVAIGGVIMGGATLVGTSVTTGAGIAYVGVSGAAAVGGAVTLAAGAGLAIGYGIGSIRVGGGSIHEHLGNGMYWAGSNICAGASSAWNWATNW